MANRIAEAINRTRANPKLGNIPESELDITFREHFAYQNTQAQAHAAGRLTTAEAQVVYRALGEIHGGNGGWSAGTDVATKVVVTRLMGELLGVGVA